MQGRTVECAPASATGSASGARRWSERRPSGSASVLPCRGAGRAHAHALEGRSAWGRAAHQVARAFWWIRYAAYQGGKWPCVGVGGRMGQSREAGEGSCGATPQAAGHAVGAAPGRVLRMEVHAPARGAVRGAPRAAHRQREAQRVEHEVAQRQVAGAARADGLDELRGWRASPGRAVGSCACRRARAAAGRRPPHNTPPPTPARGSHLAFAQHALRRPPPRRTWGMRQIARMPPPTKPSASAPCWLRPRAPIALLGCRPQSALATDFAGAAGRARAP